MIFGRRLGCVSSSQDKTNLPDIHEFVHCVQQIFVQSANMTLIPPKMAHYLNLPVWKRFEDAASKALELASLYVTENARQSDSFDSSSGIIRQLMADGEIALDEISRIIVDLFIAAADTVSHSRHWRALSSNCHFLFASSLLCRRRTPPNGHSICCRGTSTCKISYFVKLKKSLRGNQ